MNAPRKFVHNDQIPTHTNVGWMVKLNLLYPGTVSLPQLFSLYGYNSIVLRKQAEDHHSAIEVFSDIKQPSWKNTKSTDTS